MRKEQCEQAASDYILSSVVPTYDEKLAYGDTLVNYKFTKIL